MNCCSKLNEALTHDIVCDMNDRQTDLRQEAGRAAMELVQDGMSLGIGTGRTVGFFIEYLGTKYLSGDLRHIRAVPTSEQSAARLRQYGIPIASLVDQPTLDLAIDGADEVDPDLNLIKGLGRALLREKIVEIHARELVIIVDEGKLVRRLGTTCPLPVEILTFEASSHIRWLNTLECRAELWLEVDGSPVLTDNGNYLARCWFKEGISDIYQLNGILNSRPGILEHGLFLDMASRVIVAGEQGIRVLEHSHER